VQLYMKMNVLPMIMMKFMVCYCDKIKLNQKNTENCLSVALFTFLRHTASMMVCSKLEPFVQPFIVVLATTTVV